MAPPLPFSTGLAALAVALGFMTIAWVLSVALKRTDVADIAWGLGFVKLAWWGLLFVAERPIDARVWIATALATVLGLRLAYHIARRNLAPGHGEDERYAAMRRRAGRGWTLRSLVTVFWLQGTLMWIVAWPLVVVAAAPRGSLGWLDALAVVVWAGGFAFEALSDRQLRAWLSEPAHRGQPLTTGPWAWTRHPNYFGDALQWWGIGVLALSVPGGAVALIGPLLMTLLLRFVSGVPLLEQKHVGEPSWEAYRSRTSVFVPRPPRRG